MTDIPNQVLIKIEAGPHSFMIVGREKGKVLADLLEKHKPQNILEIGTNLGYSAILMAIHMPETAKITTLEFHPKSTEMSENNIKEAGLENKITVITGDAKETIKDLGEQYDFVFVDAAKAEYLAYLAIVEQKLYPGAIVVADNVKAFENEVKNYLDYVKSSGKYKSETVVVGSDALEVSILL